VPLPTSPWYQTKSRLREIAVNPFCGKPACSSSTPTLALLRVYVRMHPATDPDVDAYPGHIGCDRDTKSEIVCPLIVSRDGLGGMEEVLGVLDLE